MATYRLAQAAHARAAKTDLLPLPRKTANSLSLRYHLCLDQLRAGRADQSDLDVMAIMLLYAAGVSDNGFGGLTHAETDAAQLALNGAYARGRGTTKWQLDEPEFKSVSHVLAIHERQLLRAPVAVIRKVEADVSQMLKKVH